MLFSKTEGMCEDQGQGVGVGRFKFGYPIALHWYEQRIEWSSIKDEGLGS